MKSSGTTATTEDLCWYCLHCHHDAMICTSPDDPNSVCGCHAPQHRHPKECGQCGDRDSHAAPCKCWVRIKSLTNLAIKELLTSGNLLVRYPSNDSLDGYVQNPRGKTARLKGNR